MNISGYSLSLDTDNKAVGPAVDNHFYQDNGHGQCAVCHRQARFHNW